MKSPTQRIIEVWADWTALNQPKRLGTLTSTPSRGREIFTFKYDLAWLKSGHAQNLDPSLRFFPGAQYPSAGKTNFGMFLDSQPDRWGRLLMDRLEAQNAREEGRTRRTLRESDYLLGVYDEYRIGALRYRTDPAGRFLNDNRDFAVPPWSTLRELEYASLEIERNGAERNKDYLKWLRALIAPGGSLGGARPKAGVVDTQGRLWIAKFPSRGDTLDVGAWEQVVHQLADQADIVVSEGGARSFSARRRTFLTKRFDRTETGGRLHFASAMTLLARSDVEDASTGVSYLELAELLMKHGAHPDRDLEQLWRRIVFFICVSNADDHLRNHGFLMEREGWALSPAYDMNPDPDADGLKLNISDVENEQNLNLALEVAEYFRVSIKRAHAIVEKVVTVVKKWRSLAESLNISTDEIERMEPAFRVADKQP